MASYSNPHLGTQYVDYITYPYPTVDVFGAELGAPAVIIQSWDTKQMALVNLANGVFDADNNILNVESIEPNHEVIAASVFITDPGPVGEKKVVFNWYRDRDGLLIAQYTYTLVAFNNNGVRSGLLTSYIGYLDHQINGYDEIKESGAYHVDIVETVGTIYKTISTLYFNVVGVVNQVKITITNTSKKGGVLAQATFHVAEWDSVRNTTGTWMNVGFEAGGSKYINSGFGSLSLGGGGVVYYLPPFTIKIWVYDNNWNLVKSATNEFS